MNREKVLNRIVSGQCSPSPLARCLDESESSLCKRVEVKVKFVPIGSSTCHMRYRYHRCSTLPTSLSTCAGNVIKYKASYSRKPSKSK